MPNELTAIEQVALEAAAAPLRIELVVRDPDTVAALSEHEDGPARIGFALTALKVGVMALRAARGTIDAAAVRAESERLLAVLAERLEKHRGQVETVVGSTLSNYFDPKSGRFSERVGRLVAEDGELASIIQRKVQDASRSLDDLLAQHLGKNSPLLALLSPSEGNALIGALRSTVDNTVKAQSDAVLAEFSLDNPQGALNRLLAELTEKHGDLEKALEKRVESVVQEFSLDREDSALSRLVGKVQKAQEQISSEFSLDNEHSAISRLSRLVQKAAAEQQDQARTFQSAVLEILTRIDVRKREQDRSTVHGLVYEQAVGAALERMTTPAGDLLANVGATTGHVRNRKFGDFTITLSDDSAAPGAVIVVEAKEDASYTLARILAEAEDARNNRGAGICLFVVSNRTAPADLPPFSRHGQTLVVVWNAADSATDVTLAAGLSCAKALSVRAARHAESEAASVQALEKAIEAIRKLLDGFEEIRSSATTIGNAATRIDNRARIMSDHVTRQLDVFDTEFVRLKQDG